MARIRTIKPEFWDHEGLFFAEADTQLPIRLAFISLWKECDREGRFEWRPERLKARCMPYDQVDFSRVLDALMTRGFISSYTVDGKRYGHIPSWCDHQVVNNREKPSDLPGPELSDDTDGTSTRGRRVSDSLKCAQAERERERERKEDICGEGSPPVPCQPNATAKGSEPPQYSREFEEFWTAYPKRDGRKRGKQATYDLWKKLPAKDRLEIVKAARNYANEEFIRDPERFVKKGFWRDFLEPADVTSGKSNGSTSVEEVYQPLTRPE